MLDARPFAPPLRDNGWPAPDATQRALWARRRSALERSGWCFAPTGPRRRPQLPLVKFACAGVRQALEATGLLGRMARPVLRPRVRELVLWFDGLPPAFDGYRVLQIADPHFDALEGLGPAIAQTVRGLTVDLCVLTGDFRGADHGPFHQREILGDLAAIMDTVAASDGFLAILGNHDTHDMALAFEHELGLRVLVNEHVPISRKDAQIAVVGLDDVHCFFSDDAQTSLDEARRSAPAFRIALVHSPEFAEEAAKAGCALYLSGHTHAGQICLPSGRAVFTQLTRNRHFAAGLWRSGAMIGYTSPGAGVASSLPLRLWSHSEVTVFTLRAGLPSA